MFCSREELPDILQKVFLNNKPSPCSQSEILSLEHHFHISLPTTYKVILRSMGHGAENFWEGEDCFYRHLPQIQKLAKKLLKENNFPLPLPSDAFVFFMHQGYQFSFFKLSEGDNPPVYSYLEDQEYPDFRKTHEKLSDFLATEIDLYDKYATRFLAA
ncbi:MAG: SMI1/KNR4 family protein [Pseudanabaena sp. CAN_BIN31]|nr:SMI1/KNR4 family protein [Pseudanabaena sp. CAN_BIN31]